MDLCLQFCKFFSIISLNIDSSPIFFFYLHVLELQCICWKLLYPSCMLNLFIFSISLLHFKQYPYIYFYISLNLPFVLSSFLFKPFHWFFFTHCIFSRFYIWFFFNFLYCPLYAIYFLLLTFRTSDLKFCETWSLYMWKSLFKKRNMQLQTQN